MADLQCLGAVDHQHAIEFRGPPALDQQGNCEQLVRARPARAFLGHGLADQRVQDGLEIAARRRVGEHPCTQCATVERAVLVDDVGAEARAHRRKSGRVRGDDFAREPVAVDHRDPASGKEIGDGRLAARDAAGQCDAIHGSCSLSRRP
jgi:hypothetical protein